MKFNVFAGAHSLWSRFDPARLELTRRVLTTVISLAGLSMAGLGQEAVSGGARDKAAAYYNYSMGHLYAELAAAYGNRGEYLNQAIDYYRAAIKADPSATFLSEELAELFISAGQIRSAISQAEESLKKNPNDLGSRRILGRIYSRLIGDSSQRGGVNEEMLRKAVEQFQKIADASPKDADSWVMLGRLMKISQNSPEAEKAFRKALEADPENEEATVGLALVFADLGDNRGASELLEKVARKNPSLRTLTTLASSYEQMRDYKLAAETLRRTLELSPGNADIKKAYAQNLLFSDQFDAAQAVYEELVAEDPRDAQSWLRLSQLHRQQRQFDKARETLTKARAADPNNLEIRYAEVTILEAEGKMAEAISAMKEIVDSTARRAGGDRGGRVMLLERLGMLYRANNQPDEAAESFRQMAEADRDTAPRASAQIIETYRSAKDFPKALAEAESARQKFPADRMVTMVRANLLAEAGKADEAAREIRALLDGKQDREVYVSLAQVYEKGKNYPEMGKALDEAEKLSSSDDERDGIVFMRGAMFEKMKNFEAAEGAFRALIAKDPENASALNYLGYMLADKGIKLNDALAMIQKAVTKDPSNGAYLDSLGWVLFRLDRITEAEEQLVKAVERAPQDPTVHDHLGDVYAKQGRLKDAIAQWELSLRKWKASAPADQDAGEMAKVQKKLDSGKVRLAREGSARPKP
jgi:tetratricopeptide (TPR) repeat protein